MRLTRCSGGFLVFLAVGLGHFLLGWPLAQDEVGIILNRARKFGRCPAVNQHQPVRRQLQHMAVMADQHHRAFIFIQRLHQRLTRIDVQMVRRLIEDQHVWRIARNQRQRQPRAFATRQLANLCRRLGP